MKQIERCHAAEIRQRDEKERCGSVRKAPFNSVGKANILLHHAGLSLHVTTPMFFFLTTA